MAAPDDYLARYPEAHREAADSAYGDGFADGVDILAAPARAVVAAWERGDLAAAVRALAAALDSVADPDDLDEAA